MPGPHGDAFHVQQLGDVVRVQVPERERGHAVALVRVRAVERQARNFGKPFQGIINDDLLVLEDVIHAQPGQVIDRRAQAHR